MKIDLVSAWYEQAAWLKVFRPLSALYGVVAQQRKRQLQTDQIAFPLPVIVVGNITVGGTGKTPVVLALVEACLQRGYSPVVISRGYGGKAEQEDYPIDVTSRSDPSLAGDEPTMIAARELCPVVVDPDRQQAALYAIQHYDCDVIISDDGLQHYALARDFEIAIVDGQRGLGNRQLLPEGPLREPVTRLDDVDVVLVNGDTREPDLQHHASYRVVPSGFVHVLTKERIALTDWQADSGDVAMAAIGNPARFKATLEALNIDCPLHELPDHHPIKPQDIPSAPRVMMTEKDAIKCRAFDDDRLWFLQISAELPPELMTKLDTIVPAKP